MVIQRPRLTEQIPSQELPWSPSHSGVGVTYISLSVASHLAPPNNMGVRRCDPATEPAAGRELETAGISTNDHLAET